MFERHIQFRYMVKYITIMQHIHTPSVNLKGKKKTQTGNSVSSSQQIVPGSHFSFVPWWWCVCVFRNFRMYLLLYDVVLYHTSQLYVTYIHIHVMFIKGPNWPRCNITTDGLGTHFHLPLGGVCLEILVCTCCIMVLFYTMHLNCMSLMCT